METEFDELPPSIKSFKICVNRRQGWGTALGITGIIVTDNGDILRDPVTQLYQVLHPTNGSKVIVEKDSVERFPNIQNGIYSRPAAFKGTCCLYNMAFA